MAKEVTLYLHCEGVLMFKIREEEIPHEEMATLSALVFRFLGEKMGCLKLLDNGTLEIVLYLLQAGGLELSRYVFHMEACNTRPACIEIQETSFFYKNYLTDGARKATDRMAKRIIFAPEVDYIVQKTRRLITPPRTILTGNLLESWWLPLVALMRESAHQAIQTRRLLRVGQKEEALFLIAQENLYSRIERGDYQPYQQEMVNHRTEAWKKARTLLVDI
jgi:hypothetical protein